MYLILVSHQHHLTIKPSSDSFSFKKKASLKKKHAKLILRCKKNLTFRQVGKGNEFKRGNLIEKKIRRQA